MCIITVGVPRPGPKPLIGSAASRATRRDGQKHAPWTFRLPQSRGGSGTAAASRPDGLIAGPTPAATICGSSLCGPAPSSARLSRRQFDAATQADRWPCGDAGASSNTDGGHDITVLLKVPSRRIRAAFTPWNDRFGKTRQPNFPRLVHRRRTLPRSR